MEENNSPYQAPESEISENPKQTNEIEPAGLGLRFLNLIIDYVGFFLLAVAVGFIVGVLFGERALNGIDSAPDFVFGLVIVLMYYVPLEASMGRTLGKLITGTKVVNAAGGKPSFIQVVGRTLCRFIPFEAFSFFFGEGRGWHDSIPKTYVIKCR